MAAAVLNFNIGVLGHVDSGKTSLAKALSTVSSTASFDKNPQSQERGITLDLGFSSFCVEFPDHLKSLNSQYEKLQFTLVDCPGHASLIRTIIGGAQIIDMMILVIDITKGMQTQTAECLVIGEITCDHMLVVLNKIDLLPPDKRQALINKMTKKISKTLEKTKFSQAEVITVSAKPDGVEDETEPIGIESLIKTLCHHAYVPQRISQDPFTFSVDHCFSIRGQGTVMTGTVIQGCVSVGETIEIPSVKISRKVKSIQMFKRPVEKAMQGDRVGICVTQFDPKLLERGAVCVPGYMEPVDAAIAIVHKIVYFKGSCSTCSKFHISIMHDTVMAKCSFFGLPNNEKETSELTGEKNKVIFDYSKEYMYQSELFAPEEETGDKISSCVFPAAQYALLEFEKPVILSQDSILIGSKLDTDIHSNVCRLAFHGNVQVLFPSKQSLETVLPNLKVFKLKMKEGIVERVVNEYELIAKSLFKKETNIQLFNNLKISLSTGEEGIIEGAFGQSGKVKIRIPKGLQATTMSVLETSKKKGKDPPPVASEHAQIKITLLFKRYVYDTKKRIIQT